MEALKQRILADVAAARALGWTIKQGVWIEPEQKHCCALGACIVASGGMPDGRVPGYYAAELLGLDDHQVDDFTRGFDNGCFGDTMEDLGSSVGEACGFDYGRWEELGEDCAW